MSFPLSSLNESPLNKNEYRCPEYSLIPFIEISFKENNLLMSTKCTNNHNFLKSFDEMEKMCKKTYYYCDNCQSENNQNIDEILYYCSICYKFFCMKHGKIHKLKDNHKIIFSNNFDNICFEHNGNTIIGYCFNHNKNYCFLCDHFDENHRRFYEKIYVENIENYEKEINNNEKIINKIELLFKNYKKIFNETENFFYNYKENINKKIKFMKEIINFYKTKKEECVINYQMKVNIKKNKFNLSKSEKFIINNINNQIDEAKNLIDLFKKDLEVYENQNLNKAHFQNLC